MLLSDFTWIQELPQQNYRNFTTPISAVLPLHSETSVKRARTSSLVVAEELPWVKNEAGLLMLCNQLVNQGVLAMFVEAACLKESPWLPSALRNCCRADLILKVLPDTETYQSVHEQFHKFETDLLRDPEILSFQRDLRALLERPYTVLDLLNLLTSHLQCSVDLTIGANMQPFTRHNSLGILNLGNMVRQRQYEIFSAKDYYVTMIGNVVVYVFCIECLDNGPGILILHTQSETRISSREIQFVRMICPYLSIAISQMKQPADLANITKRGLLLGILREQYQSQALQIRSLAVAAGVEYKQPRHVAAVEYTGTEIEKFQQAMDRYFANRDFVTFTTTCRRHRILVLEYQQYNGKNRLQRDISDVIDYLSQQLPRSDFRISASHSCHDLADLLSAYHEAKFSMVIGRQLDPEEMIYWYRNYMDYHIICSLWGDELVSRIYENVIERLHAHDRKNDSCLLETLEVLVKNNFNINEAAETMNLHRNTVYKRMERIDELVSGFLDNPNKKLLLQIAVKIKTISEVYGHTETSFDWNL